MSGLVKAKRYDWKDTNLALFGSDTDKKCKKESANHEPAWQGVGQKVELRIWRIVKFKVTEWPKEDYGKFFSGDSYIVLNTYKADPKSEDLSFDAHFWIGSNSTQDEYGTVAYKTVELDMFLDDKAVQHREVEGYESDLFQSYFPSISIMEGGAESGFRHVKPEEYRPRLLHFSGQKQHINVKEVPLCPTRLNPGDVFILDLGSKLYQWNGPGSSKDERFKAVQYLQHLKSERGNATSETLQGDTTPKDHPFYQALTGQDEVDVDLTDDISVNSLHRVSDAGGHLKSTKLKEGSVSIKDFDSNDVFILDTGNSCFVWIGNGASPQEKQNGIGYAHMHLMKTTHPLVPIHVVKEGQPNKAFTVALAA
jgi:gelsolin